VQLINFKGEEEDDDDEQVLSQFTDEELEDIEKMKQDPILYDNLVRSIAPSVFGTRSAPSPQKQRTDNTRAHARTHAQHTHLG
jgi:hypothetical protein